MRYGLLGLSGDILEVRALAREGGAGPLGPAYERTYWTGTEWSTTRPTSPEVG